MLAHQRAALGRGGAGDLQRGRAEALLYSAPEQGEDGDGGDCDAEDEARMGEQQRPARALSALSARL
jgi:hypothetical protein